MWGAHVSAHACMGMFACISRVCVHARVCAHEHVYVSHGVGAPRVPPPSHVHGTWGSEGTHEGTGTKGVI